MLIRWLGAFGKGNTLADAIYWELTQTYREIACERVSTRACIETPARHSEHVKGFEYTYWREDPTHMRRIPDGQGYIRHAMIGLWIDKRAVIRNFPGDVWSQTDTTTGRLFPQHNAHKKPGRHTESFVRPGFVRAIIIKRHPAQIRPAFLSELREAVFEFSLPVFWLRKDGKRVLVTKEVEKAIEKL